MKLLLYIYLMTAGTKTPEVIKPQPGFQEAFLSSPADIVVGGSGAGVGKTYAELLEAIRHKDNKDFGAVFFRRTYPQITIEGGLWDESMKLYPKLQGKPNETKRLWKFPKGSTVSFAALQYDKDVITYQGAQIPLIIFDELTHFTEKQFWYMISRNRSTCGVKPYVRASCNPDPDSWVARLIEWWIDQETGYPIPERSGKLRYFIRHNDVMVWADSKEELIMDNAPLFEAMPESKPEDLIKSLTFIPGSIYENKALMQKDPLYLANLMAQDEDTKARLLKGNWKIRTDKTSLFDSDKIKDMFSNHISDTRDKYITCDAARFGRDLCVIMVWRGWEVIHIEVIKKSDVHDITDTIEALRLKFQVSKSQVLVDQDGVGADTVKMGDYKGFSGGGQPRKVQGLKEIYENLKTQCYYYLAEKKVNIGDIKINVNNGTCVVDGVFSTKVKLGSKIMDITEMIRDDLRSVKRRDPDHEKKIRINTKIEQKIILGRSPDFGDTMMMRALFEFVNKDVYL